MLKLNNLGTSGISPCAFKCYSIFENIDDIKCFVRNSWKNLADRLWRHFTTSQQYSTNTIFIYFKNLRDIAGQNVGQYLQCSG